MCPVERLAKLLSAFKSLERYINVNTRLEEGKANKNEGNWVNGQQWRVPWKDIPRK